MDRFTLSARHLVSSAVLFLVGGTAAYIGATRYGLGEFLHLGAGAFPFLLGLLLMALSLIMIFTSFAPPEAPTREQWLGALAVFGGIAAFAISLNTLGLVPAVFALTLISRLAEPPFEPIGTLGLAAVLAVLAYLVFVFGLRLPLEAFIWL
ncbi:tripartite tricarboxylate transporter TctB family protein [Chelativorans sp. M5D2P16]|uniref:tripartite tricarboxylate transporter TctB family protein n=1 Tax=Chelativorans sp. M5D2P16 TaxID=3095678 RepID=UPI002ACA78C0|nr:tripartite tricarboxylate transporter TctB family protein [Chelativorans sp. M5D2P16]MDZ5696674.1 tripartite tricarboxylate transporter TctB family protein [Chelativorans sp. M5D2P16]